MTFKNVEDRLNPATPEGVDDTTLGGYLQVHGRAAAFEGVDGRPYTVAVEAEETGGPGAPWVSYLVFPRWADTGTAVMGHVETGDLAEGESERDVRAALDSLPLARVRQILDDTIERRQREE